MPRKLRLTPRVVAAIQARRRAGATYEGLAQEFKMSIGSIRNAITAVPKASVDRVAEPGEASAERSATDLSEPAALETLEQQARDLRALQRTAKNEGNVAAVGVLARVLNNTLALQAKLQPPPPVDPAAAPDMKAAALSCRDKLEAMAAEGRK